MSAIAQLAIEKCLPVSFGVDSRGGNRLQGGLDAYGKDKHRRKNHQTDSEVDIAPVCSVLQFPRIFTTTYGVALFPFRKL